MKFGPVLTNNKWLTLPDELVARYNAYDCINTAYLIPKTTRLLEQSGNLEFFQTKFWPLVPVVGAMQRRGFGYLDKPARNKLRHQLRTEITKLEESILNGTTGPYTDKLFNSPKQLAMLLFDEWGLPTPKATRTRKARSTDLHALAWLDANLRKRDEPLRPKLHDLFHRSRLQTILERYLCIDGDVDGRVRPTIKLGGTETGRFAYAGGPGEALQQWPSEIRPLIQPSPGCVFVGRDYQQIEARILAVLSRDKSSLSAFAEGRDIHSQNCCDLFGFSEATLNSFDFERKTSLRNYAKAFLYGLSYGGKADSIKMRLFCPCSRCTTKAPPQINLSRDEIKLAANRWEQIHSSIMVWRSALVESVFGYGQPRVYTSPFGYHRRFWEPQSTGERSLMNFPMQHCAAQVVNRAMVALHALGQPLVLQMHDELVVEVPADQADQTNQLLKDIMEQPVPELNNTIFPTTGHIGENWGSLK